jgi:hypothetical protein
MRLTTLLLTGAMAERGQQYKDGDPTTTRGPCRCGYRHWFQGQEYDLVGTLPIETGDMIAWNVNGSITIQCRNEK